jgi:hypothetical protein
VAYNLSTKRLYKNDELHPDGLTNGSGKHEIKVSIVFDGGYSEQAQMLEAKIRELIEDESLVPWSPAFLDAEEPISLVP